MKDQTSSTLATKSIINDYELLTYLRDSLDDSFISSLKNAINNTKNDKSK